MSPLVAAWIFFGFVGNASPVVVRDLTEPECMIVLDRITDMEKSWASHCVNIHTGERMIYRINNKTHKMDLQHEKK